MQPQIQFTSRSWPPFSVAPPPKTSKRGHRLHEQGSIGFRIRSSQTTAPAPDPERIQIFIPAPLPRPVPLCEIHLRRGEPTSRLTSSLVLEPPSSIASACASSLSLAPRPSPSLAFRVICQRNIHSRRVARRPSCRPASCFGKKHRLFLSLRACLSRSLRKTHIESRAWGSTTTELA